MTLPAALSILTTTFREGRDRNTALGVWGGVGGLASAAGVLLGGLLTEGPGWRWVMFVNPVGRGARAGRDLPDDRARRRAAPRSRTSTCSAPSWPPAACWCSSTRWSRRPIVGWGSAPHDRRAGRGRRSSRRFVANERRQRNPLAPLSIFRINGLGFANATQLDRVRRLPGDVLLPHPVHAERPGLLADPDRPGLPAAVLRDRHLRRDRVAAAHPRRHAAGDRRRRGDLRGRALLALADPRRTAPTSPTCCPACS